MGLSLFSSVSAIGGGIELIAWPEGNRALPPIGVLQHTPFTSFLVPGLLLALVIGGTSLTCAVLAARRSRVALDAAVLSGGALTVWIVAQVAMLRNFHWLHGIYGGLGLAILGLGLHGALCPLERRRRWLLMVTAAETLGFLVPSATGILLHAAGVGEVGLAVLVVVAGAVEGLALGAGQALSFPLSVRRIRYALLTSLGAAVVWASVLSVVALAQSETTAPFVVGLAGMATAAIGLLGVGTAQWFELRHHTSRAHLWIPWTALAWALALPFSFTPGPFVDESTPLASHIALWACGGALMAYVMASITWQGVRRLPAARWVGASMPDPRPQGDRGGQREPRRQRVRRRFAVGGPSTPEGSR